MEQAAVAAKALIAFVDRLRRVDAILCLESIGSPPLW
jgi:hypothetical protein